MTPDERMAAHEALRPQAPEGSRHLVLANGMVFDEPDALLAVLPPDGVAARTARSYRSTNRVARVARWSVWLSVLGGLVLMPKVGATVGVSMISAGFLVATPVALIYTSRANRLRLRGLLLYEEGLRQRLDLCPTALRLVPCETLTTPGTVRAQASLPRTRGDVGLGMRAAR